MFHQAHVPLAWRPTTTAHVGDTPAFTTFDFSGGFGKNNWKLEGFIQNVFDERGELGRFSQCNDSQYCNEHARVYPIKPQFFGVKFSQNF